MKKKQFAIVDLETTGGSARYDRIIEVAIVLHDGNEIIDQYQTLVNPKQTIPEQITRLTGITNEMVADAPEFYEIAREVVERTESAVFVAHNVRFDYGFLKREFERLGYTYSRRLLCTVRLSRKTLPGLRSYSLGNLIKHFDIKVKDRHRALADALATAELLEIILQKESGSQQIDALVNEGIKETNLPSGVDLDKLHGLPEECGVYYFHDENGGVIYVGKSLNIKKRVMNHFSKTTSKSNTIFRYVRDISFEITGSELVSLLLESYEIKRLQPFINRAQRNVQFPYTIQVYHNQANYLSFEIIKSKKPKTEGHTVVAEFPKQSSARGKMARVVEQFELCRRLCDLEKNIGSCFYHQINLCRGGCVGKESIEEYNERAQNAIPSLGVAFENNFFLIDQGRTPEERAIVLIEEGLYRGFGFVDADENDQEQWKTAVKSYPHNPDVQKIIRSFVLKDKLTRIAF